MSAAFHPDALDAALAIVRHLASGDAADLMAGLIGLGVAAPEAPRSFELSRLAAAAGFEDADPSDRTVAAARSFVDAFETRLGVVADGDRDDGDGHRADPPALAFKVFASFVDLLRDPWPALPRGEVLEPDAATGAWGDVVAAASRDGRPHHLALRCDAEGDDGLLDFGTLVRRAGASVVLACPSPASVAGLLLRSELHGGERPVVLVDVPLVFSGGGAWFRDDDPVDRATGEMTLGAGAPRLVALAPLLRCVYVWRAPATGEFPRALDGVFGGCTGPVRADPAWSAFVVGAMRESLGVVGAETIVGRVADPRRAGAIVAMADAAAGRLGCTLDEACGFVVRSFGGGHGAQAATRTSAPAYDPRLFVGDEDALALLDRSPILRGLPNCRILLHGPPGGGKSAYARELCRRMTAPDPGRRTTSGPAGVPVYAITAATLCVREYGGSERILRDTFARALAAGGVGGGAPILADEFDTFCAARDHGSTGGNAYLVRSMTNEFLRNLDDFPFVPVVATCNAIEAIDPAVLRRCTAVIAVGADLPPDLERLAWELILGMEPPTDWRPVGAAASDFASARDRCAMLGRVDAASHSVAVAKAREARVGVSSARGTTRGRSVH